MKYGKPEQKAQEEIEEFVESVLNRVKIPFVNVNMVRTLGIDKFAKSIMKISQNYVESKLEQMVGKKYVLRIEENGQEDPGRSDD